MYLRETLFDSQCRQVEPEYTDITLVWVDNTATGCCKWWWIHTEAVKHIALNLKVRILQECQFVLRKAFGSSRSVLIRITGIEHSRYTDLAVCSSRPQYHTHSLRTSSWNCIQVLVMSDLDTIDSNFPLCERNAMFKFPHNWPPASGRSGRSVITESCLREQAVLLITSRSPGSTWTGWTVTTWSQ